MYEVKDLNKVYASGEIQTQVLHHINLSIKEGSFVVILGPSGSGKTTLLNILSGLDNDYTGSIQYENKLISSYNEKQMVTYRKEHISLIFQHYHLLPTLNVQDNVEVASQLVKKPISIDEVLSQVRMLEHKNKYPNQLSGGQKQRVAIARAIVKAPKVIFCDEPTGALDSSNAKIVMELLLQLNRNSNVTVIIVTHNESFASLSNHIIRMSDGHIKEQYTNTSPLSVDEIAW